MIKTIDDLHAFTHQQNPVNMKIVLKQTMKFYKKYNNDPDVFIGTLKNNLPLPQSTGPNNGYPLFRNYPNESVAFSAKHRAKILLEQENALRKAESLETLKQKTASLLQKEIQFREQQESLLAADKNQALKEKSESELRILEKMRLDDLKRHDRIDHLKSLEETLHVALSNQESQRQIDLDRLNAEFATRQKASEYDYHSRLQDEAINNMEQKASQRIMELMSLREREDRQRQLKSELTHKRQEDDKLDSLNSEKWKLEDEERSLA